MDLATVLGVHRERYTVNGQPCEAVADFANDRVTMRRRGMSVTVPMDKYTNFVGNMRDFVIANLFPAE